MVKDYLIIIAIWFIVMIFIASMRGGSSSDQEDYPVDSGCHAGYNC